MNSTLTTIVRTAMLVACFGIALNADAGSRTHRGSRSTDSRDTSAVVTPAPIVDETPIRPDQPAGNGAADTVKKPPHKRKSGRR